MRLINTDTGVFEEFIGRNIPKYAILSHTWEEEEVSFSDMQKEGYQRKKGYVKIYMTCKLARDAGIQYAWVDTCCIDKSSSAELSEAINSMYRWYQRSVICYAYLSDLSPSDSLDAALPSCRWFTRGWTLQELIAPSEMRFFDSSWVDRGSKETLCIKLSEITGINVQVLRHEVPLASIAVAQRMAWAAKRETTRIEDRSYSLLGLFGVNMSMLYGEEEGAFRRLQEEIIKSTLDMSIFAWKMPEDTKPPDYSGTPYVSGLLAYSPDDFWDCLTVTKLPSQVIGTHEFSLSNKGIKLHTRFKLDFEGTSALPVGCPFRPRRGEIMAVRIAQYGFDQFLRQDPWELLPASYGTAITQVQPEYFLSEHLNANSEGDTAGRRYSLKALFLAARRYSVLQFLFPGRNDIAHIRHIDAWPKGRWDEEDKVFFYDTEFDNWGRCGARFVVTWTGGDHGFVPFNYTLLTDYWSSELDQDYDGFWFTIADANVFKLPDARFKLPGQTEEEFEKQVDGRILELGVPRASQVVTKIKNTELAAVLSVRYSQVVDKDVCCKPFRRLQFHFEVVHIDKAPTPVDMGWDSIL
ncbi:HET-domain-containing protein [Podospora conica]|nr:HET-domain-containing protein [Schizothecium conicum]